MPSSVALSVAMAGNMILLFTLSTGVHALHVVPSRTMSSRNLPSSLSLPLPLSPSAPLDRSKLPPNRLFSSTLFGTKRPHTNNQIHSSNGGNSNSALRSSTPNGSDAVDAEVTEPSSPGTANSSTSFSRAVDNFGMKLKPWALGAHQKSVKYYSKTSATRNYVNGTYTKETRATATSRNINNVKSILCKIQANILWVSYIIYRGYRGFVVILPAVFRDVYRQLEESDLVLDVYGDEDEKEYAVNANSEPQQQQKQQEPMRLRTRITISVLSGMLTLSYVISGALRVLGKFIKTFTNTTSIESSFEAAAEEVVVNEDKLRNKLK